MTTKIDGIYSFTSGTRRERLLCCLLVVYVDISRNCSFRKILIEPTMATIYSQAEVALVLLAEYGELVFLANHQIPIKSLSKIPAGAPVRRKTSCLSQNTAHNSSREILCEKELLGVNRRSALEDQVKNTWGRKIQN